MTMHSVGGEGEQVEGIVGTLKGLMAFWYSGSDGRYETSKEKGGFKIYIFPHSDQLGEVLKGNDKHQAEFMDHNMRRPQAFFTKAYVPVECIPREAEMEMREKELLVSTPFPHGQAISFKMKLQVGSSIILDEIRDSESSRDFHLREYTKSSSSLLSILVISSLSLCPSPLKPRFLPSIEGSPPLTLSSFLLSPGSSLSASDHPFLGPISLCPQLLGSP
ncbi:uncharacterized protein G2W53_028851 [Senna tora]|uniref:Uncharacterized protein n=1 Tax=Senna tora TaxID=362788 RepID=A0A834WA56_9FABA|nr:uncharacterized protein G2W53_028851 [Senna tora]